MLRCTLALLSCLLGLSTATHPASASEMPKDFVYLRDVDPTIQQDMRYAGADNFTGRPVPGYDAPECVLVRQVGGSAEGGASRPQGQGIRPSGL